MSTKEQVRQINYDNKVEVDVIQYRNKQKNFSNKKIIIQNRISRIEKIE